MTVPYSISYSPDGIKSCNVVGVSQKRVQWGFIAKTHGSHREGFSPPLTEGAVAATSMNASLQFNSAENFPPCKSRLKMAGSRNLIRSEEKSPELLQFLMDSFASQMGHFGSICRCNGNAARLHTFRTRMHKNRERLRVLPLGEGKSESVPYPACNTFRT